MDTVGKLFKTAKGKEEIEQRRYKLAGKLRTLLILVDGSRSANQLADDGRKLGAPDDALLVLMRDGFVAAAVNAVAANDSRMGNLVGEVALAEAPADEFARFRVAKQFMNETAVDNLGTLKKFTFTLKLERCSVRTDLANLLPDYERAMTGAIGRDAASVLVSKMRELLS
ncbi:MAG: hypothetical protein ABIS68_09420 [Casimicrobiaceae bacterium]